MDVEKIADGIFKNVQARIDQALAPLVARLEQVEAKEIPEASAIIKTILAGDELATLVNLEVTEAVSQIPAPKDGEPGEKGHPGKDGVGLAGALIDRDGNLVVTEKDPSRVKIYTAKGEFLEDFEGLKELVQGCNRVLLATDSKGRVYLGVNRGKQAVLQYARR